MTSPAPPRSARTHRQADDKTVEPASSSISGPAVARRPRKPADTLPAVSADPAAIATSSNGEGYNEISVSHRMAKARIDARIADAQGEAYLRARGIDPRGPFQLGLWPDDMRAIPNDYARSALFTVRNKREPRAPLEGAILFHIDKRVKITFTGIELRADDDLVVWQQLLEYGKRLPLGEALEFNLHQLCRDLNWSINGRNYDKARRCISRLKANEIKVANEHLGKGVGMSLIQDYEFDGDSEDAGSRYRVWIHRNLMHLFAGDTYTRVAWAEYRELTPIARRLYDYIASHKQPFPLMLDKFYLMCASTCESKRKWTQMVKGACAELTSIGLVKKAWVAESRVYCERG